jgi:hypothetical protein
LDFVVSYDRFWLKNTAIIAKSKKLTFLSLFYKVLQMLDSLYAIINCQKPLSQLSTKIPRSLMSTVPSQSRSVPWQSFDEPQVFRQINEPQARRDLLEQEAAFKGEKGAVLSAVSVADGTELAQYDLESPPVFDGMAAASRRLYLVTLDGRLVCMAGKK